MIDEQEFNDLVKDYRHQVMWETIQHKQTHLASALTAVPLLVKCFHGMMRKEDDLVFSKGHGSVALTIIQNKVKKLNAKIECHPEIDVVNGIKFTLGSLGQGLPFALGEALADPKRNIFAILSDGDFDEGSTWETLRLASELKAKNLMVLVDANGWQNYKENKQTDLAARLAAFGWDVGECTDKQLGQIEFGFGDKPAAVIVHSIKGEGLPGVEGTLASHYFKLSIDQYEKIIRDDTATADDEE